MKRKWGARESQWAMECLVFFFANRWKYFIGIWTNLYYMQAFFMGELKDINYLVP